MSMRSGEAKVSQELQDLVYSSMNAQGKLGQIKA